MTDDHQPIRVPPAERPVPRYGVFLLLALAAGTLVVLTALLAVLLFWIAYHWNVSLSSLLGVGIGLFAAFSVAIGCAVRYLIRHGFQFSLRAMFIAVTLFAILLSVIGRFVSQQRAMWHLAANGGYVYSWSWYQGNANQLVERLGYDPFADISEIWVESDNTISVLLDHPNEFADLEGLILWTGITDASLERAEDLNAFSKFYYANFIDTDITKRGMEQMMKWRNLRELDFAGGPGITDDSLFFLQKLPELESLTLLNGKDVRAMPITDAGMVPLERLSHLKRLNLIGLPITDRGLVHLKGLTNLEKLTIHGANITQQGFEQLCTALPDCWITWHDRFPGPEQVRRIVVWDIAKDKQIGTVCQTETVAAIAKLLNQTDLQDKHLFGVPDSPLRFRLDFYGARRCFCRIALGDGCMEVTEPQDRLPMSEPELHQLLDLLGVPCPAAP